MLSILSRRILLFTISFLFISGGCGGSSSGGDTSNGFPDLGIKDIQDVHLEVSDDAATPDFVETDGKQPPGPVELSFFAPTICGCSPTQIPPVDCGWFSGPQTTLKVRATHTYDPFEGAEGINRVKLLYVEDIAEGEELNVAVATAPNEQGMFILTINAETFLPKNNETGNIQEGTYFFRVEATSKIKDENGDAMVESKVFALTFDITGPTVNMISPNPNLETRPKFIESFPVALLAQDTVSGLSSAHFFFGETEIEPSVTGLGGDTGLNPLARELDISEFPTQTGAFKVEATDCIGNKTVKTLDVDFIGTPKFDLPPRIKREPEMGPPSALHVVDMDENDGLDDILVLSEGMVGLHRSSMSTDLNDTKVILQVAGLIDAQMVDYDSDGFLDIIALVKLDSEKRLLLYPQIVQAEETDRPIFAEEPTQNSKVDERLEFFKIHDMNLDGFPDLVLAGSDDALCVAVMLHSQRTYEDTGPGKTFLSPSTLSGVTNISDMAFGFLNGDEYPDALVGRRGEGFITALINNLNGGFAIAQDTSVYSPGTDLVQLADLDGDGNDDAVHSAISSKSIFVSKGNGLGYFYPVKVAVGQSVEDFGSHHVAGVIDYGMLDTGTLDSGEILSIGSDPDSMVLANLDDYSEPDIAVAIPDDNRIAVFLAESAAQPGQAGRFKDAYFTQPGLSPHSLVIGRFDSDPFNDLACIAGEPGELVVLFNRGANAPGKFVGPQELPMPVKRDWTKGRLEPTHFVVRDIDNFPGTEIVVVTEPDKQEMGEDDTKTIPMILAYLSNGALPELPPIKSPTNPELKGDITGLGAGYLDTADTCIDLAISYNQGAKTPCDGRNFDVLRGCRRVVDTYNNDDPDNPELDGFNADYFKPLQSQQRGHFWALGGYLGLQQPSGIAVAPLDTDALDDVILLAPRSGNPEQADSYQPNQLAAYLTRFDKQWQITGENNEASCPQYYDQTWFRCAPYWPLQQTSQYVCKDAGDEPPPCLPATGDDVCMPGINRAKPADKTTTEEVGHIPVAVAVGDFYPDGFGCNDIMVAWETGNVTYLRSSCSSGYYNFHQPDTPPNLFAVGANPVDLKAGDLDDDGYIDAVAALEENLSVVYGVPGGGGFETPKFLIADPDAGLAPSSLSLSDVNEDGKLDIMFTIKNTGQLGIFVSGGDRTFFGPFFLPCGTSPIDSAVADMDGDGCLDVAVLNQGSKSVTILKNQRCGQ